jgi:hypothetical protein
MERNKVRMLIDAIVKMRGMLDDAHALEVKELYPVWKSDAQYVVGERILYNETLYKVLAAHDSQANLTPDIATSLFTKIAISE